MRGGVDSNTPSPPEIEPESRADNFTRQLMKEFFDEIKNVHENSRKIEIINKYMTKNKELQELKGGELKTVEMLDENLRKIISNSMSFAIALVNNKTNVQAAIDRGVLEAPAPVTSYGNPIIPTSDIIPSEEVEMD